MTLAADSDARPLAHALQQLAQGASLTGAATTAAFDVVMRGEATPAQIGALLLALRTKGETPDEVAGAVTALRRAMIRVPVDGLDPVVDTCGTGGGVVGTLNISTAAAFVVAGAGVAVAKHGNRSFTSRCGSADVLEALGVDVNLGPDAAAGCLREAGFAFLFAPLYHPAMRHVGPVRRELGVPTIMNLLGPLSNPAGVTRQVVGVADAERAPLIAEALGRLGATHALVVHAAIGMDEISPSGETWVWEVCEGRVERWVLDPARHKLACDDLSGMAGGEPADNARCIEALFAGAAEPSVRCAVLLNAAAALYVAGRGRTFEDAVDVAHTALTCGGAAQALERVRRTAPLPVSTSG